MLVLFAIEAVLVATLVKPLPPTPKPMPKPEATSEKAIGSSTIPWSKIAWFYFQVALIPFNVAGWEVVLVLFSTQTWGWSIEFAAGILSAVNLAVAITTVLKLSLQKCVKDDGTGNIVSFALSAFAAILFFQYPAAQNATVSLFCIGGFITLFAMQNGKGFTFALNSKWSRKPAERKRIMVSLHLLYACCIAFLVSFERDTLYIYIYIYLYILYIRVYIYPHIIQIISHLHTLFTFSLIFRC